MNYNYNNNNKYNNDNYYKYNDFGVGGNTTVIYIIVYNNYTIIIITN